MDYDLSVLDNGSSAEYFSWGSQQCTFKVDGEAQAISGFLLDPKSLKTGWGRLAANEAPSWVWADIPFSKIKQPEEDYKAAFGCNVYLTEKSNSSITGKREWNSCNRAAIEALKDVLKPIGKEMELPDNAGKLAAIKVVNVRTETFGSSPPVNIPVLELVGWSNKPTDIEASKASDSPTPKSDDDDEF